jgi:hypothetical protein
VAPHGRPSSLRGFGDSSVTEQILLQLHAILLWGVDQSLIATEHGVVPD